MVKQIPEKAIANALDVFTVLNRASIQTVIFLAINRLPKDWKKADIANLKGLTESQITYCLKLMTKHKLLYMQRMGKEVYYTFNYGRYETLCGAAARTLLPSVD